MPPAKAGKTCKRLTGIGKYLYLFGEKENEEGEEKRESMMGEENDTDEDASDVDVNDDGEIIEIDEEITPSTASHAPIDFRALNAARQRRLAQRERLGSGARSGDDGDLLFEQRRGLGCSVGDALQAAVFQPSVEGDPLSVACLEVAGAVCADFVRPVAPYPREILLMFLI